MTLRLGTIVVDVKDMKRAVAFWREALAWTIADESDNWTTLSDPQKKATDLALQRDADAKSGINRIHFDFYTDDVAKEVKRLEALGAHRAKWDYYSPGAKYVVMQDPEGNEFCVCPN